MSDMPDLQTAIEALRAAQAYRGQWMLRVAQGEASIFDVIQAAQQPYAEALGKIRLNSLLENDPLVKYKRKLVLQRTIEKSNSSELDIKKLNIKWLLGISRRTNSRLYVFAESYLTYAKIIDPVVPRFPWTY
jgi:triacylglycerol esterase/lipase EstA (alpha/beta hydrolase family)